MDRIVNVYIWDMDETLILLKSLLNGTYAQPFNGLKDVKKGVEIGKMWENYILQICDDFFFYEQIENCNNPFLDSLSQYDDGLDLADYDFNQDGFSSPYDDHNKRKLAYRHRVIANRYKQEVHSKGIRGKIYVVDRLQGLHAMFDQQMLNQWEKLYDSTDEYTDKWLSSARAFLEQCSDGRDDINPSLVSSSGSEKHNDTQFQHTNVIVTSGSLIPSLAKCLLFQLNNVITHGNVYSSWEVGKIKCFQMIKERFTSPNVRFCVIGDGWEESEAAETMRWPFIKIDPSPGSNHRFPGLTLRNIGYYFSVIYGSSGAENDEE